MAKSWAPKLKTCRFPGCEEWGHAILGPFGGFCCTHYDEAHKKADFVIGAWLYGERLKWNRQKRRAEKRRWER